MRNGKSETPPPVLHLASESSDSPPVLFGYQFRKLFHLPAWFFIPQRDVGGGEKGTAFVHLYLHPPFKVEFKQKPSWQSVAGRIHTPAAPRRVLLGWEWALQCWERCQELGRVCAMAPSLPTLPPRLLLCRSLSSGLRENQKVLGQISKGRGLLWLYVQSVGWHCFCAAQNAAESIHLSCVWILQ